MIAAAPPLDLPRDLLPLAPVLTQAFQSALGCQAAGLWVFGSAAHGHWNPRRADLDLLAVVEEPLEQGPKLALLEALERLWPMTPPGGLEITVVLRDVAARPFFPTPYEFHYSPGWRAVFRRDPLSLCSGVYRTDRELLIAFALVRIWGIPLLGPPAETFFSQPSRDDMMSAFLHRARRLSEAFGNDPTPTVLELCRGLAFAREELILSREEAGRWAQACLPRWSWLISRALEDYKGCYRYGTEGGDAFCCAVLEELSQRASAELPEAHAGF